MTLSIKHTLILLLFACSTLALFIAAIHGHRNSTETAHTLIDNELKTLAETLLTLPISKTQIKPSATPHFAFQLWQGDKLALYSEGLTENLHTHQNQAVKTGFSQQNFLRQRWQVYSQVDEQQGKKVIVALPLQKRISMAEDITLSAVTPLIYMIPLLSLVIYFLVKKSLSGLSELSYLLKRRRIDDLQNIKLNHPASELIPVLATLNSLFSRLSDAYLREKKFAADAAHELRNPVATLKVLAYKLQKSQPQNQDIQALENGVDRMGNIVEQILLLNRAHETQVSFNFLALDLEQLCQQTIADLYPQIIEKNMEISLDSESIFINTNHFLISSLLQNLLSNSIKYSLEKSKIKLSLSQQEQQIILLIEDSGPGINEDELNRVMDRFYRVGGDSHNSGVVGSGLGLSIVKQIVQLHKAKLSLSRSTTLGGLKVSVLFNKANINDVP